MDFHSGEVPLGGSATSEATPPSFVNIKKKRQKKINKKIIIIIIILICFTGKVLGKYWDITGKLDGEGPVDNRPSTD